MKKLLRNYFMCVALVLSFLLFSHTISAEVVLNISRQGQSKLKIAVCPIEKLSAGTPDKEIYTILSTDMLLSGFLEPITNQTTIDLIHKKDLQEKTIHFSQWNSLGAAFLIKSKAAVEGNQIILEVQLYSVSEAKIILSKRFSAVSRDLRKTIHSIDHSIVKTITGEDSIFMTKIAFNSNRTGVKQIYVSDFDGYNVYAITHGRAMNICPAWVPQRNAILCTSYQIGKPAIQMLDLAVGSNRILSAYPGLNALAKASANGQKYACILSRDGNPELYMAAIDGTNPIRLTHTKAVESSPCFSPDGSQIAYVSDQTGTPQIYVMDIATRNARRITHKGSYNCHPDWAFKGNRLLYCSRQGGSYAICVIDLNSNQEIVIPVGGNAENPCWAPNGIHIAFSNGKAVFLTDIYGLKPLCITRGNDRCTNPTWSS